MDDDPITFDALLPRVRAILDKHARRTTLSFLLVGCMGSGKTQTLDALAQAFMLSREPKEATLKARWSIPDQALISALGGTNAHRMRMLNKSGVNTAETYFTPPCHLSGGESSRISITVSLLEGNQVIDDLECRLDEHTAKMTAIAARRNLLPDKPVFFATKMAALAQTLQPDYVIWIAEPVGGQRRYVLLANPNATAERRALVTVALVPPTGVNGPFDREPQFNPYAGIRGDGDSMAVHTVLELTAPVRCDRATAYVTRCTSKVCHGHITKSLPQLPMDTVGKLGDAWLIGCIVGPSGCGKSATLRMFPNLSTLPDPVWDGRRIIDVLGDDYQLACRRAIVAGLTSDQWSRPYSQLSAGEQASACMAYVLQPFDTTQGPCIVTIDEVFSYSDAYAALGCAYRLRAYLMDAQRRGAQAQLVVAGAAITKPCLAILQPEWIFDPSQPNRMSAFCFTRVAYQPAAKPVPPYWVIPSPDVLFRRFVFNGTAQKCSFTAGTNDKRWYTYWRKVEQFHYLSDAYPKDAYSNTWILRCSSTHEFIGLNGHGSHVGRQKKGLPQLLLSKRLVILPKWQGMGIGPALSEAVAAHCIAGGATNGKPARYHSVTANVGLASYRTQSGVWEENVTSGTLSAEGGAHGNGRAPYVQYSHAYVGPRAASASAAVTNGGATSGLALQEHDDDDDFV
jgi:GNAT superfamily N-acetyltransferase